MSIRYISTLPVLAAMAAVLAVSCARADADVSPSGEETGEAIRYEVMNSGIEGVKSSINEGKDLGEITLRSADGGYSLTLGCTATPTQDEIPAEITKGAPVTSEDIDTRYNDGSIRILAYNEGTTTEYIPQQKLVFMSRESGSSKSRWKTATDYIWPETGSLEFWSWAPGSSDASDGKVSGVTFTEGKMSFTYTSPKSGDSNDAELQKDVLLSFDSASGADSRNVNLLYKHALSAIRFKVDKANKCTVKSVSLSGVYGSATCSFDGTNITWSDFSGATSFTETFNKEINEYLKDDYASPQGLSTEEGGGDTGKTFMLIPQSATDAKKVTMTLVVLLEGASEDITLSAELDPSDAIWEAGWTYTYGIYKDSQLEVLGEVKMNYLATEGTKTYTVNSDRPWQLQYTLDDGATWTDAENNTIIDGWISFDKVSGVGSSDEQIVTATVYEAEPEPITITIDHTSVLRSAAQRGSSDAPWDLSTHDVDGNLNSGGKATTANCYVISAPGWYAFPLVYGNAIKEGIDNTPAYKNTAGTLTNFLKADGTAMESPYISGVTAAYPLWEDVANFAIVADDGCTVLSQTDAAAKGLNACNCGYVMFEVTRTTIKQGNAVVAVTDEKGIIQWSWHIWVTDDELTHTVVKNHDGTFNKEMLDLNLGWVDDSEETDALKYSDASLKLRFVQKSETSIINEVSKTAIRTDHIAVVVSKNGSAPTWQWGRKDPFIRNSGGTNNELPSTKKLFKFY